MEPAAGLEPSVEAYESDKMAHSAAEEWDGPEIKTYLPVFFKMSVRRLKSGFVYSLSLELV